MPSRSVQVLFVGACLGLARCEESELSQQCGTICGDLNCGDGVNVSACRRQCVNRMDSAEAIDDDCAQAYQALLECLEALRSCGATGDWASLHGSAFDYPCRTDSEHFLDQCGELWFKDER